MVCIACLPRAPDIVATSREGANKRALLGIIYTSHVFLFFLPPEYSVVLFVSSSHSHQYKKNRMIRARSSFCHTSATRAIKSHHCPVRHVGRHPAVPCYSASVRQRIWVLRDWVAFITTTSEVVTWGIVLTGAGFWACSTLYRMARIWGGRTSFRYPTLL